MKKLFFLAAALSVSSISANAEQVRIVVSQETAVSISSMSTEVLKSSSKKTNTCLLTTDGLREICFPSPVSKNRVARVSSANPSAVKKQFTTMTIDADSVNQVVDTLKNTGWYYTVEADVPVSTKTKKAVLAYSANQGLTSQSTGAPNDPEYMNQTYLHEGESTMGWISSNITQASDSVINKTRNVGVAVLDSGFAENDELTFTGGYSFVTSFSEEHNENYFLKDGQERTACGMHGYAVAGVMTTAINDAQTIAGIINGVDTYALRVMNCGLGYLSDSAAALNYLAKQDVNSVPMFTGNVEVANMSLGGQIPTCPSFMQDAIDNANDAGITVVVAAGNGNIDTSGEAPANCEGVLVVGAASREGERADFSNFGPKVNMSAQGIDVLSFGYVDKDVYWWEGTSFSTPLVAASVALAKRDAPSLTPRTMRWLAENTTSALKDTTGECETYGCGSGILDANALVLAAQKAEQGELSTIRHVLAEKSTCDQQWYIDHFGASAKLCNMYRVTFFDGFTSPNTTFKLLRANSGEDIANGEELLTSETESVLLQDIDTSLYDYGFKTCENGRCSIDTHSFTINAEKMTSPAACN